MRKKNVYFAERPDKVMVTVNGDAAIVEMPTGITEIEAEDGTQYCADVYYVHTKNTPNLKERVERNYDAWLEVAQAVEQPKTTVEDLAEAINVLTDIVIGGMI